MRPISLRHLIIAKQSLPESLCKDAVSNWGVCPKESEYVALSSFLKDLEGIDSAFGDHLYRMLDICYFGFSIPQISKEFDCLWIGETEIVNVELKSGAKPEEEIKKQLQQNSYYLRPLGKTVHSFTYVSSTHTCYQLDDKSILSTIPLAEIAKALFVLHKQHLFTGEIESLFLPENYLVSPFNSTEAFLREEYFLTSQQEGIKKKLISSICDPSGSSFFALTGGPGSGKTLLLYDIAKTLMDKGKTVVIGHSGGLNQGQEALNSQGWDIRQTNKLYVFKYNPSDPDASLSPTVDADIYLIDESQRSPDIDWVVDEVRKKGKKCIFSFDSEQYLNKTEQDRNNEAKILTITGPDGVFKLSSSIRTNEAVFEFVRALFDKAKGIHKKISDRVEVSYCVNPAQVLSTMEMLKARGYRVPQFTPNASPTHPKNEYEDWFLSTEPSAHEVIGQEFDAVACLISPDMYYDASGKLTSRKAYYYIEDRMLYQILSRARCKVHLIVFNNQMMLSRCLDLLKKSL